MALLLTLLLAWPFPTAHASTAPETPTTTWTCTLQTVLYGNADFFLRYGRDSWTGAGQLSCVCASDGQISTQNLNLVYNSRSAGIGVNESSWLSVAMKLITTVAPPKLQLYAYVVNQASAPQVSWQYSGNDVQLQSSVFGEAADGISNSLKQGALFLRSL